MFARLTLAMLCGGSLLWTQAVSAQVVWERTLSGEWVVNHLATGIQSAGSIIGNKIAFNLQIEEALNRFFATLNDPVAHVKAEQEFSRLLLEKDLYYIALALANPVRRGNADYGLLEAFDYLAGVGWTAAWGNRKAFTALVRSLRSRLGAADDRMPIAIGVMVPGRYEMALKESLPEFQAHITDRNRHEYSRYAMKNPGAVDPANPMFDREMLARTRLIAMKDSRASSNYVVDRVAAHVRAGIQQAEQASQHIIECKYGRDKDEGGSGSSTAMTFGTKRPLKTSPAGAAM